MIHNVQDAIAPLRQLQVAYPNVAIYLSGSVTVDFPEEVSIPVQPNQYPTAGLVGNMLNLEFHPLEQALLQLQDQYAVGTMQVRIVQQRARF
ncbi:MAG: hypothetical protein F6K19_48860 [Cyanothece sp. SIO1E1]|nr:hypothetical protein [Cyanothece sp. SIO1E1]